MTNGDDYEFWRPSSVTSLIECPVTYLKIVTTKLQNLKLVRLFYTIFKIEATMSERVDVTGIGISCFNSPVSLSLPQI